MTQRFGLAVLLLMAAGLGGCASAASPRASVLAGLFAPAALARSERLAPDLLSRARRARSEAEHQPDPQLRRDDELRARLLLTAAQAEADRIELAQQVAVLETQADEAQLAHAKAQRVQAEAQAAAQVELARRASLQRAHTAFAVLMQDEPQPARNTRSKAALAADTDAVARARAQAGELLLERARLITAAATALGAEPDALTRAQTALGAAIEAASAAAGGAATGAARRASPPAVGRAALLSLQLTAFSSAEQALGSARARQLASTGEQTRDLLERMRELGVDARADLQGVVVHLQGAFPHASAQPQRLTQLRFALLSAVLCAFPAGALQVSVHVPASVAHASTLAQARAKHVQAWLGQQLDPRRLSVAVDVSGDTPGAADSITLVLPAYVPAALGP